MISSKNNITILINHHNIHWFCRCSSSTTNDPTSNSSRQVFSGVGKVFSPPDRDGFENQGPKRTMRNAPS